MDKAWIPVPFQQVRFDSGFWKNFIDLVRTVTVPVCMDKCINGTRGANFRRAAGREEGGFQGIFFDDSDVYKVLEGVAYVLQAGRDEELEKQADALIDDICACQLEDGYLDSYFILTGIENRWTDENLHEAYCLGHMIEGAVAYAQATGKEKWLNTAIRFVEHMMSLFGPGKENWVPGHEELEQALVRLYRYTGREEFLDYSKWLVDIRGSVPLKNKMALERGSVYCQADKPARDLERVTGHAVRAMYYYSAMADLAGLYEDEGLRNALIKLWGNVVPANLYITGGIGQQSDNEGFTRDWHLPNLTAYCETCAAIGMAMWNHRMNLMEKDGKYADLVERELYNGILSGLALDGKHFFYDNPLASAGKYARSEWFACSCCPTNLARFVPSVGGYAYAVDGNTAVINQYFAGDACLHIGGGETYLHVDTCYPWEGSISIKVPGCGACEKLRLRIPGWCKDWTINVPASKLHMGYIEVDVQDGTEIVLTLDMPVRAEHQDARILETRGRAAIMRGPLVYCAEEIDNPGFATEYFHAEADLPNGKAVVTKTPDLLGGVYTVSVGDRMLIPYYAWNNRGRGGMAVWLKENAD